MAPEERNKFAASIFGPEVFWKQMYCCVKRCLWYCWDSLTPRSDPAPGELCPLLPSLRLWCYAIKIGKFSESKQIFKAKRHEHLQFSKTIRHGSCTCSQQIFLAEFQVSLWSFCVTSMSAPRVLSAWTCVCFANNKTFPTFNKLLF